MAEPAGLPLAPTTVGSQSQAQEFDDEDDVGDFSKYDESMVRHRSEASWRSETKSSFSSTATLGSASAFLSKIRRSESMEQRFESDTHLRVLDAELLRGISAHHILRRSHVLASNADGGHAFALSKPVDWLNIFISHTWLGVGWVKRLGIAYCLNVRRAVVVAVVTDCLVHALDWGGISIIPAPFMRDCVIFDGAEVLSVRLQMECVLSSLVFGARWRIVLLWGQELPINRTVCFLDKCCIHQTDPLLKLTGIRQLGAVLRYSEYMMILLQPQYFRRAWCVYELAAFLYMNNGNHHRVWLQPLKLTLLTVAVFGISCSAAVAAILLLPWTVFSPWHVKLAAQTVPGYLQYAYLVGVLFLFHFCVYIFPSRLFWRSCKGHMHDRQRILQQVRTFSLSQASCFDDGDLEFIQSQIGLWFADVATFEKYVRHDVAARVKRLLREQGPMPYRMVIGSSMCHLFFSTSLAFSAWRGGDMNMLWRSFCAGFGTTLCGVPIAVNLVLRLVDAGLAHHTAGQSFFHRGFLGPLVTATVLAACTSVPMGMLTPACPLWLCAALCLLGAACVCRLFHLRPSCRAAAPRRPGGLCRPRGPSARGAAALAERPSPAGGPSCSPATEEEAPDAVPERAASERRLSAASESSAEVLCI
ncbi:unnamed protein product [Prorocentrum cordatum]|uniref:Autophagy-related protein 9 n=1 Tax=Prorocentrum cordatum TaxID=2364126 RepID=A0ABN9WLI0_9DINO|nr:unnamed protein product [Polarella glacialis]